VYSVEVELRGSDGGRRDFDLRLVGFRSVEWRSCEGAPAGADPWICAINGVPVFLQGVNWTPVRPNFADVTEKEVFRLFDQYKTMGCNILRVWGGAVLEKESFY
jgi:beta-mannosidase